MAGRYEIEHLIARGGMGEVYQAHDTLLRRMVAIKVIRSGDGPNMMERFAREAYLAARFDHPNIVRIYDLGRTPEGFPFLVMELLEGQLFTQLLSEEGPMDGQRVVELLSGVADALDLVHREGVIHRDIKLENLILVETSDGSLRSKLLDFGVALPPSDEAPRLTADGAVVGTPLYAPPEALVGGSSDASADVYSLAVVAYKLLTGTAPFEELPVGQMLRAKVTDEVLPPSTFRPDLPPSVDEVLTRALARDPSSRPQTTSELLGGLLEASTVFALPRVARGRGPLFFAAGCVAFVLAGLILLFSSAA